jgi:Ca2+-binding EF-hand superfamily protein
MYRHTVEMYAGDESGRAIVETGHDWLNVLKPEECLFIPCLILTHQENVADQQACLRFWSKLEPLLPTELHVFRTIFEEHLRIVDLCGNFPHRDHYYGRTTSAIGKKLMDNPGLRFDLPLIAEGGHVRFGHDSKKLWDATQMTFNVVETLDAFVKNKVQRKSTIVTDWLTPEKAAECREGFRKFDKDGNGFLDMEELVAVLQATGRTYTKAEVQLAIDSITGTKGGTGLTFEQFAAVLQVKMTSDTQNRIRARFQLFDSDNTGDISFEELTHCLQGIDSLLTSSELTEMMKKCDTNGDGMISYEEFVGMVPAMMSPTTLEVNQNLWDIMSPVEPSSAVVGGFGWGDIKKTAGVQVQVHEVRAD